MTQEIQKTLLLADWLVEEESFFFQQQSQTRYKKKQKKKSHTLSSPLYHAQSSYL